MTDAISIRKMKLPEHVAVIMDGNRRWADIHGLPRTKGHEAGLENLRKIVKFLSDLQIKYSTVFAFSTENWGRPKNEVEALMNLLERRFDEISEDLAGHNVRLKHIGGLDRLSPTIVKKIKDAVEKTGHNTGLTLLLAFNYGGRAEIVNATRQIIKEGIPAEKVDETLFTRYLYTRDIPDVDLLIRTGGELRISNFLIWQSAYAEYYFSDSLWPDFGQDELKKAMISYSQRKRRFGRL